MPKRARTKKPAPTSPRKRTRTKPSKPVHPIAAAVMNAGNAISNLECALFELETELRDTIPDDADYDEKRFDWLNEIGDEVDDLHSRVCKLGEDFRPIQANIEKQLKKVRKAP